MFGGNAIIYHVNFLSVRDDGLLDRQITIPIAQMTDIAAAVQLQDYTLRPLLLRIGKTFNLSLADGELFVSPLIRRGEEIRIRLVELVHLLRNVNLFGGILEGFARCRHFPRRSRKARAS